MTEAYCVCGQSILHHCGEILTTLMLQRSKCMWSWFFIVKSLQTEPVWHWMREERGKGGSEFCFMDAQKKMKHVLPNGSLECNASPFEALINYFFNQLKLEWSNFVLSHFVPLEMEQNDPCQMFLELPLKSFFFYLGYWTICMKGFF